MFSQASICPQEEGVCGKGGGACEAKGGMCGEGDMHGKGDVCGRVRGVYGRRACLAGGGVHGRRACMAGGGACLAGETATASYGTNPTGMYSVFFQFMLLRFFFTVFCLLMINLSESFKSVSSCCFRKH